MHCCFTLKIVENEIISRSKLEAFRERSVTAHENTTISARMILIMKLANEHINNLHELFMNNYTISKPCFIFIKWVKNITENENRYDRITPGWSVRSV